MKTRRKFLRTGASALGIAALSRAARAHDQTRIPSAPAVPREKLDGWQRLAAPQKSEGDVTMMAAIYAKQGPASEIKSHTNIDQPPVTFFAGTLRYTGDDDSHGLDGASVSVPLPLGFGVNLPISLIRSVFGFTDVPIPESVERRARNAFASGLEREQQFDHLEAAFGDFPDSETYHKSGYQTLTDAYEGEWANSDGDGVVEDVDFEGVLSIETTGEGHDFLAVGGMYPVENSVTTAAVEWPEFDPEALQTELKALMRATRLPGGTSGGG